MNRFNPTRSQTWPATFVTCFVLAFLLLPTLIVVPVSFGEAKYLEFPPKVWSLKWYAAYFADSEWIDATKLSLTIAAITTVLTAILSMPLTLALERGRLPARNIMRAIVLAPMIVPHIVIAVAMYITFSRWGLTGKLPGFVAAHAVLCLPFFYLTLAAGVGKLDPSLEMAATNLGASKWSTWRHITLPLLMPSILGGMAFVFITSLDEAVVSNFLSGSVTKVLAKKMFEDIDFDVTPVVAAVSSIIIVGSLTLAGLVQLLRLRLGASRGGRSRTGG